MHSVIAGQVLGDYYRRMRAKLGAPKAITAAAHKLARIIFHLLTTHEAYDETVVARRDEQTRKRTEAMLRNHAKALGLRNRTRTTDSSVIVFLRRSNLPACGTILEGTCAGSGGSRF